MIRYILSRLDIGIFICIQRGAGRSQRPDPSLKKDSEVTQQLQPATTTALEKMR